MLDRVYRINTLCCVMAAVGLLCLACKPNKSLKKPVVKPDQGTSAEDGDGVDPTAGRGGSPGGQLSIVATNPSGTTFEFDEGSPVKIQFSILGGQDRSYAVALADFPTGGALQDRDTTSPTFVWSSPAAGTHNLEFLLRDLDRCAEDARSESDCHIDVSDFGDIKTQHYDVTENFRVHIKTNASPGIGGRPGSGGVGGSGSEAQLIQQIVGLLQGGGMGNVDINQLTNLLGGLGGGDLSSILGGLQSGGLDVNSLFTMLGGYSLTNPELPPQDPEALD